MIDLLGCTSTPALALRLSLLLLLLLLLLLGGGVSAGFQSKCDLSVPVSPSPKFDFIFGISTGHVGSTTFSNQRMYSFLKSPKIVFMFESRLRNYSLPPGEDIGHLRWVREMSYAKEYKFVQEKYIPFLLTLKTPAQSIFDLGHHNLYFLDALVDYFDNNRQFKALFVRLRRPRYETALSLMYQSKSVQYNDICQLTFRYCPLERVDEVIIKIRDKFLWKSLTIFQKALWLIDEVEERFLRIKTRVAQRNNMTASADSDLRAIGSHNASSASRDLARSFSIGGFNVLDVVWSKNIGDSVDAVACQIATHVGGMSLNEVGMKDTVSIKTHSNVSDSEAVNDELNYIRLDYDYQLRVGYQRIAI